MLNRKIEYFVTLAECLSFTQAAAVHSVSQTAISQYIASLEAKLQVRLFNRNAHAVSDTGADGNAGADSDSHAHADGSPHAHTDHRSGGRR